MAPRKKSPEETVVSGQTLTKNKKEKQENPTLEQALKQLDAVMEKLESGELSLEESFHTYQQGMELVKYCNDSIDRVEKQLMILEEEGI